MKYSPGIGIGFMSGSFGGVTASHNRYGPYFRPRVIPVNPQTFRQNAVRGIFAVLTNRWVNVLTALERAAWDVYAANIVMVDSLGQNYFATGFNHYIRSNHPAARASFPMIDAAPVIMSKADQDHTLNATASEATQVIAVTFDDTKPWCSEDEAGMSVLVSRPASASVNYIPPVYRYSDTMPGDSIVPITSPNNVASPWPIAQNQQIIVQGRIVRADGRLSDNFRRSLSVGA